jgi:large subunit ribosomal protein L21
LYPHERNQKMFAVVEIAGKQFSVSVNDTIVVPSLNEKAGTKVKFDRVLLLGGEKDITVGHPLVAGANVQAEVVGDVRGDTVIVFKKKKRKGYRVRRGHRQAHTEIKITNIGK